jgi:hypothetical protein
LRCRWNCGASPAATSRRIDRRFDRAQRSLQRTFAREMKAIRAADVSGGIDRFADGLGNALGRVDLARLTEQAGDLLAAARKRAGL